jgi:hypothetical protein
VEAFCLCLYYNYNTRRALLKLTFLSVATTFTVFLFFMPSPAENMCLKLSANQMPDSGWQPGLTSNVQLFLKNTTPYPVSVDQGEYAFFIDGTPTGISGSFPGLVRIRPNSRTAQEHCPVDFPAALVKNINGGKLSLQITTHGSTPESTVSGSCTIDIAVSDIPGPFRQESGRNVSLELAEKQFDGIQNIDGVLAFLDKAYDCMVDLTGHRPMNGITMALREVPPFFAFARAGFPILLNTDYVRQSIEAFDKGSVCYGWLHEMGHDFEYGYWYMYNSPSCEFHANIKLVYALEQLIQNSHGEYYLLPWKKEIDSDVRYESGYYFADQYFLEKESNYFTDTSRDWLSLDSDELMIFYLQLVRKHGWEPLKQMYRTYRALTDATLDRPMENNGSDMFTLQMAVLSHILDEDIVATCAEWRMPITEAKIAAMSERFDLPRYTAS